MAAAELLPHRPVAAARALGRGCRVRALVAAALDEAAGDGAARPSSPAVGPPYSDGAPIRRNLTLSRRAICWAGCAMAMQE